MMSTAFQEAVRFGFKENTQATDFWAQKQPLGMAASFLLQLQQAWGGFEENYSSYQNGTDPHLEELRPKLSNIKSLENNSFMKSIRGVAASIWIVNMVTYLVLRATITLMENIF